MDEVLEKLQSTFVCNENKESKTNFESLYKNWGKLGNQEERRKELLDTQKNDRHSKLDKFRGILELVNFNEDNIFKDHKKVYYRPNIYVAGFNRTSLSYSNVLMFSEWIIEKPADFSENWYITPCPKGVRVLVIATQGRTKLYTKCGRFKTEFRTALPGGNPCNRMGQRSSCCVLDCFYQETDNTLYVIDLLAWNNQPMTDCETEFRHFWLQSQLTELPGLRVMSKSNKVLFSLLPKVPCTPESLNAFMMTYPPFENNFPALDGLLFYHKRAHYVSGQTPLVGWLYPFMVQEVLGSDITVHPLYMYQKPSDYVDQATFIQKFEEKNEKRKAKYMSRKMNTSNPNNDEIKSEDRNKFDFNTKNEDTGETNAMDAEESPRQLNESMDSLEAESDKSKSEGKNVFVFNSKTEESKELNAMDAEESPKQSNENIDLKCEHQENEKNIKEETREDTSKESETVTMEAGEKSVTENMESESIS